MLYEIGNIDVGRKFHYFDMEFLKDAISYNCALMETTNNIIGNDITRKLTVQFLFICVQLNACSIHYIGEGIQLYNYYTRYFIPGDAKP